MQDVQYDMLDTPLCRMLGIRYPIIQAGMPGIGGPEMVAAVSNAGGLGIFAATMMPPDVVRDQIRSIRALTSRPFAVNLLLQQNLLQPLPYEASTLHQVQTVLNEFRGALGIPETHTAPPGIPPLLEAAFDIIVEERVPVFSIGLGNPSPDMVARCQAAGIKMMAMVCTPADAQTVVESGVDIVVAQGSEAGGHRSTWTKKPTAEDAAIGTLPLVSHLTEELSVPVVAAGGICTGKDIATALRLGAQGVQMGTRFVATVESHAPESYKRAIVERSADETRLTDAFTGMWARVLRNSFTEDYDASGAPVLPPGHQLMAAMDILRNAGMQERMDYYTLYCGQGIDEIDDIPQVGVLMERLVKEAKQASK